MRSVPTSLLIVVENLTYTYPRTDSPALREVTLEIPAGQFCSVIGANGAGKSTLAYALAGYIPHFFRGALSGRVTVDGRSTLDTPLNELVLRVGLVFQNPFNQISATKFTVQEEIAFGLENLGVPPEEMHARVADAMRLVGVEDLAERSPPTLSGGQMQRVVIASVLVMKPTILVLDEPTSQLDPIGSREVFAAIQAMTNRENMTVVMVEHKLEWVAEFADRVIAIADGLVVGDGTPREILTAERLLPKGIGQTQYTQAARRASTLGYWPPDRAVPVTLAEAAEAFQRPSTHTENSEGTEWPTNRRERPSK